MYPLIMQPCFRSGAQTPWGGEMLKNAFMKSAPEGKVGESLEVSALNGLESVVKNGEMAGKKFSDIYGTTFPLLLKLLDARDTLSVQVHPGDEYALQNEGKLGKTEAWVILGAEEGARIAYGLKPTDRPLNDIIESGEIADYLDWRNVTAGDVYYLPHGMIHALGGGIQAYEIQQSSDVTYRIWDWGRTDAHGNPRELHISKAKDSARTELHMQKLEGATVLRDGGSITYYISDDNFELARLNVNGRMKLNEGRMIFITPTTDCELEWNNEKTHVQPFETAVIPPDAEDVYVSGRLTILRSAVPDGERLAKELGYRAADVGGLVK